MNPLQHKNVEKGQFVILGIALMVLTMENRYSYNSNLEFHHIQQFRNCFSVTVTILHSDEPSGWLVSTKDLFLYKLASDDEKVLNIFLW